MIFQRIILKPTPLCLLLAIFCVTALSGEEAAKHTYRIIFPDRPSSAPTSLHLFDGTSSREVDLPSMNLSPVYELSAGPLQISLLPHALDDPKKLPADAPSALVPAETTEFYLIVTNNPDNKVAPVHIRVVDAGQKTAQPGHMLWLNLTQTTVEGELGTEKVLIPPDSSAVVAPPRKDAGDYPVDMRYRADGKDTAAPICQTVWTHSPHTRELGLVFTQQGSRIPRIAVFPDFR